MYSKCTYAGVLYIIEGDMGVVSLPDYKETRIKNEPIGSHADDIFRIT